MKKIMAIVLAVLLAFCATGCAGVALIRDALNGESLVEEGPGLPASPSLPAEEPADPPPSGAVTIPTLPLTLKGLTLTKMEIEDTNIEKYKITYTVKNDTGKSIQNISNISYKCYDTDGVVVESSKFYLNDMAAGESTRKYTYIPGETVKIDFSEGEIFLQ